MCCTTICSEAMGGEKKEDENKNNQEKAKMLTHVII